MTKLNHKGINKGEWEENHCQACSGDGIWHQGGTVEHPTTATKAPQEKEDIFDQYSYCDFCKKTVYWKTHVCATVKFVKAPNKAGGVSRKLPKNKAILVPSGTDTNAPTSSSVIEEAVKRFDERFVLDPVNVFFGDREELKKKGWEVGKSKLIVKQDTTPEELRSFLSSELQTAITSATGGERERIKEWAKKYRIDLVRREDKNGEVGLIDIIDDLLSTLKGNHEE